MFKPLVAWFTGNGGEKAVKDGIKSEQTNSEPTEPIKKVDDSDPDSDLRYVFYTYIYAIQFYSHNVQASDASCDCWELIISSMDTMKTVIT